MTRKPLAELVLASALLIAMLSCYKGEIIKIINDGNERIEVVTRPTYPGSAKLLLIHHDRRGHGRTVEIYGFDSEGHHEVASVEFNRESQTAKIITTAGNSWRVDLKTGNKTFHWVQNQP